MKINVNSWHYKLNNSFHIEVAFNNLCSYFWATVLSVIMLYIFLPFLGLCSLFLIAGPFLYFFFSDWVPFGYGLAGAVLDIGCLILFWGWYRKEYVIPRKIHKEPSLVKSYITAKKSKICPLIEYVDE